MLKASGYAFKGIGQIGRSTVAYVQELADECGTIVQEVNRNIITNLLIFNERLIHTFFNCVSDNLVQRKVLETVALQQQYANVDAFLRDLTFARVV